MEPRLLLTLITCAAFCITGCRSSKETAVDPGTEHQQADEDPATPAESITIADQHPGNDPAFDTPGVYLFTSQAELMRFGSNSLIDPQLDLERFDLVVVALGEKNTGGYGVEIDSISLEDDVLHVQARATSPAPDAITTQAITHPITAALIDRTEATRVEVAYD